MPRLAFSDLRALATAPSSCAPTAAGPAAAPSSPPMRRTSTVSTSAAASAFLVAVRFAACKDTRRLFLSCFLKILFTCVLSRHGESQGRTCVMLAIFCPFVFVCVAQDGCMCSV